MNDKEIIGNWEFKKGKIIADLNCQLIESMLKEDLSEFKTSEDGWKKQYKGKEDDIWELTFPQSHLQGGGPPKLTKIK
jgi:hypothetical protein